MDKGLVPNFDELGPIVQRKLLASDDAGNICPICYKRTPYSATQGKFLLTCCRVHGHEASRRERIKTNQKKYGGPSPYCSPTVRQKARDTVKRRYGVDNVSQTRRGRAKVAAGNRRRSGTENMRAEDWQQMVDNHYSQGAIAQVIGHGQPFVGRKLHAAGMRTSPALTAPEAVILSCIPQGLEYINHDRSMLGGKEIDIYLPSLKMGIEVHGAYWHSEQSTEKEYHYRKWKLSNDVGIRLLQIFDYELIERRKPIITSMINATAGNTTRIYARKCTLRIVRPNEARPFYERNHWQGFCKAHMHIGLYYQNALVMCASFGRSRFERRNYELIRISSALNTIVVGGVGKLISAFQKEHTGTLVSYSDNRLFNGNSLEAVGFTVDDSRPRIGYVWYNNAILTRYQCQKHKLSGLLGEAFDPNETEVQNMQRNGWVRVFDAGQTRWTMKL